MIDLADVWRRIAYGAQDRNAERLVEGRTVGGSATAPKKGGGRAGVASGELLADLTRRGNVVLDTNGFTVAPSPSVAARFFAFCRGRKGQPARPVGGFDEETLARARDELAVAARDQVVEQIRADS